MESLFASQGLVGSADNPTQTRWHLGWPADESKGDSLDVCHREVEWAQQGSNL